MRFVLIAGVLLGVSSVCLAADDATLQRENAQLRQRLERLERDIDELRKLITEQAKAQKVQQQAAPAKQAEPVKVVEPPKPVVVVPPKPVEQPKPVEPPKPVVPVKLAEASLKAAAAPAGQLSEADLQKLAALVGKETANKKPVWSQLDVQLYGYVKADASYDDSRTTTGNYIVYVDSEATNKNDNEFNLTANQTRLGLKINGPAESKIKSSGLVEFDFYGGSVYTDENKAKIQMRHAYMNFEWPAYHFSILAGQTSDTMSPLVPDTLNYTVLWDGGNIGYRRPQIRLTKGFGPKSDVSLKLEGAVARTIGRTSPTGSETGEDAGFPILQGRVSVTFPGFARKPATVGFSGHWGREEYDTAADGTHQDFDSWSVNLDVSTPVNDKLMVKGELFNGVNLNTYLGGIGQGVNITTLKEIAAKGGWVAATLGPWGQSRFNVGYGLDDVDADDVANGARTLNRCLFGNFIYSLNKNAEVGLELSHWRTDYKGSEDADDMRAQASFIYKF
jgi:hypothetical protein